MNDKKLIFAGLPMVAVAYGLSRFSYGLLSPYINNTLHLSVTLSGNLASLSYLAYCFAIIFTIWAANHISAKTLILIGGSFSIIGLTLIFLSSRATWLGIGVFICGLSTGIVSPPYSEIVNQKITNIKQNQTNSWINAGTSIGIAFGGIIAILYGSNWRIAYLIFTIIAIIVFIINYITLPKINVLNKDNHINIFKEVTKHKKESIILILSSLLIGISCSAYWTFSRTFLLSLNNIPNYIQIWLWPIIGISGLLGGYAGWIINQKGLNYSYLLSVFLLTTASLLLGIYPNNALVGIISPILFGGSYIFMTSVLLVWGITIFKDSPALGLGLPFLVLAIGQTIGTIISGNIADKFGFYILFISLSIIGYLSLLINPKIIRKNNK